MTETEQEIKMSLYADTLLKTHIDELKKITKSIDLIYKKLEEIEGFSLIKIKQKLNINN